MQVDINKEIDFPNFREQLPSNISSLLDLRDGPAQLVQELPRQFTPESVAPTSGSPKTREQRLWELVGLYYLLNKEFPRPHEALAIFSALYYQALQGQAQQGTRTHKGMPLLWISECYRRIGYRSLAKRYLMLTHCEDAILFQGRVDPDSSGTYFRLVWIFGMPDPEVRRYSQEIHYLFQAEPNACFFPEWVLQKLDQIWKTETPELQEASTYVANTRYIAHLISALGDSYGKSMERLADYVLACIPGCRTTGRKRSASTEYDIVCSIEGLDIGFLSELGRYFVCECKDTNSPADFSTLAKFCRVLDSTKSKFGILFSKHGISGEGRMLYAERERIKVYQDRGVSIVVINHSDLNYLANGGSLLSLLRAKYEALRLDLLDLKAGDLNSAYR